MHKFTLSNEKVQGLSHFADSIPMTELGQVKDVRMVTNTIKDLESAIGPFMTAVKAFSDRQGDIIKKHREEFEALPEEMTAEERDVKKAAMTRAMNAEVQKELKEDAAVLDKMQKEEVEVELSDDKAEKLRALFIASGTKHYQDKGAYLDIADALNVE